MPLAICPYLKCWRELTVYRASLDAIIATNDRVGVTEGSLPWGIAILASAAADLDRCAMILVRRSLGATPGGDADADGSHRSLQDLQLDVGDLVDEIGLDTAQVDPAGRPQCR